MTVASYSGLLYVKYEKVPKNKKSLLKGHEVKGSVEYIPIIKQLSRTGFLLRDASTFRVTKLEKLMGNEVNNRD